MPPPFQPGDPIGAKVRNAGLIGLATGIGLNDLNAGFTGLTTGTGLNGLNAGFIDLNAGFMGLTTPEKERLPTNPPEWIGVNPLPWKKTPP